MTLEVRPDDLRAAGSDMWRLGDSVSAAYDYVNTYVQLDSGGSVYDAIRGEIEHVRSDLTSAYGPSGPARSLFYGAGGALITTAYSYEHTDKAQRDKYDKLNPAGPTAPEMSSGWEHDDVGVDKENLLGLIDSSPENDFSDYERWADINDTIDSILGFQWVGEALGKVGVDFKPTEWIEEEYGGDWAAMGRAIGGLEQVKEYWYQVSAELEGVVGRFDDTWSGHAANAARTWFATLQEKTFDHAKSIGKTVDRVKAEALAFLDALSTLEKAIDAIAGMLPSSDNLGSGLINVLTSVLEGVVEKIKGLIDVYWAAYNGLKTAAHGLTAAFAQLTRFYDTEWPSVPAYPDIDVDGPAA